MTAREICQASIVIATYRRPGMLADTLRSLLTMRFPSRCHIETIVVDNDPEATSREVVEQLRPTCEHCFHLRYVHEPRKGLSYARNRGIEEARGEVLLFLDDDVFVATDWLVAHLDCLQRTGAACVGGRTLVHWEGEPDPVLRACEREIVAVDFGDADMELNGCRLPGGGNAAFPRSVFAQGLRFATELGRVGTVLLSGEDTELMTRLRRNGGRLWYCSRAVMYHRTGGDRLTAAYIVRQKYWFGVSFAVIDRRLYGRLKQIARAVLRAGKALLIDVPRWQLAAFQGNARRQLLARCAIAKQWGYVRAACGGVRLPTATSTASV